MKYTAEVIIRTEQFEADDEFRARAFVAEFFRKLLGTSSGEKIGQIIEFQVNEVEDID